MESMCFVRQQATSSHTTRCQVVILFWKIEKRGSGGCARMRGSGGSFCGGVWAESCHEFYSTKFWGLIIIFGATEFREAFLQRFCLINLKDLLRSWDLGVVTFWESHPAFSGSAPFFSYCQFSCGKNRKRDEVPAGLLAVLQSRQHLPSL